MEFFLFLAEMAALRQPTRLAMAAAWAAAVAETTAQPQEHKAVLLTLVVAAAAEKVAARLRVETAVPALSVYGIS